jgi:hypothetical protein
MLFRADCFDGTHIGTSSTISAEFRIDHIDVTLTDSLHRAFIDTGAARGTLV